MFDVVEQYAHESHWAQSLLRCRKCNQLYYFVFREEIDWDDGDDPQYSTYIPVESKTVAEQLKKLTSLELLAVVPRLHKDFPKAAKKPNVYWIGKYMV